MNTALALLLAPLVLVAATSSALASEPPSASAPASTNVNVSANAANANAVDSAEAAPSETRWYGYQPLVADGVALSLFAASVATYEPMPCGLFEDCARPDNTASSSFLIAGALVYAFASPTIHALHGHWGKAGGSLGLRLGAPLVGLAVGSATTAEAGALTASLGALAAMVVDDVFLARETIRKAPSLSVAPTYDAKTERFGLAVGGEF